MKMDKAFVILGEASESDDENLVLSVAEPKLQKKRANQPVVPNKAVIVAGEASESESDSEDACREAFFAKSGATKNEIAYEEVTDGSHYDTLLHKKLRECNNSLYCNVKNESRQSLNNTIRALNSTNQQLLVTQIQVQDAVTSLGKALDNLSKLNENLDSLLSSSYIPNIENV